jgi:hypothetical protein
VLPPSSCLSRSADGQSPPGHETPPTLAQLRHRAENCDTSCPAARSPPQPTRLPPGPPPSPNHPKLTKTTFRGQHSTACTPQSITIRYVAARKHSASLRHTPPAHAFVRNTSNPRLPAPFDQASLPATPAAPAAGPAAPLAVSVNSPLPVRGPPARRRRRPPVARFLQVKLRPEPLAISRRPAPPSGCCRGRPPAPSHANCLPVPRRTQAGTRQKMRSPYISYHMHSSGARSATVARSGPQRHGRGPMQQPPCPLHPWNRCPPRPPPHDPRGHAAHAGKFEPPDSAHTPPTKNVSAGTFPSPGPGKAHMD